MVDLCEMMDRSPEENRAILDELLREHQWQIALRRFVMEPAEGEKPCALP